MTTVDGKFEIDSSQLDEGKDLRPVMLENPVPSIEISPEPRKSCFLPFKIRVN